MSVPALMHLISIAEYIEAAAAAFAALRLFHLGLFRAQAALSAFISLTAVFLLGLAWFPPDSRQYFTVYLAGTVLSWFVATAAVRQVFTLLLGDYRGLRSVARRCVYYALALSTAASLVVDRAAWRAGPSGHSAALFFIQLVNRSVVLALALFIALFLILMSRYPLHLQRNTMISCAFFGALFLAESLTMLIDSLSPRLFSPVVDMANLGVSAFCFVLWGVLLRRQVQSPQKVRFNRADEDRLLRELEAINAMFSRSLRK